MEYNLTVNDNNEVEIVKKAGNDYVRTVIPEGQAKALIEAASNVEKSDKYEGLGIAVNGGEVYIAGTFGAGKAEPKAEPKKAPAKKTAKKAKE